MRIISTLPPFRNGPLSEGERRWVRVLNGRGRGTDCCVTIWAAVASIEEMCWHLLRIVFFSCPSHKVLPFYGTFLSPVRGQVFRCTRIVLAGRNSAGCNPILMTVDVSCSHVSHISSLVLLGDEFSGFVKFRKPFRDFNRLLADMSNSQKWRRASVQ